MRRCPCKLQTAVDRPAVSETCFVHRINAIVLRRYLMRHKLHCLPCTLHHIDGIAVRLKCSMVNSTNQKQQYIKARYWLHCRNADTDASSKPAIATHPQCELWNQGRQLLEHGDEQCLSLKISAHTELHM